VSAQLPASGEAPLSNRVQGRTTDPIKGGEYLAKDENIVAAIGWQIKK
jgi:hypothetical protein